MKNEPLKMMPAPDNEDTARAPTLPTMLGYIQPSAKQTMQLFSSRKLYRAAVAGRVFFGECSPILVALQNLAVHPVACNTSSTFCCCLILQHNLLIKSQQTQPF
jgi:hypothetical protein